MQSTRFDSWRLYILFLHLISTTFLIWTRYPSIQITLKPNYSSLDYNQSEDSYLGLIAFGIVLLLFQMAILPFNIGKLSFRSVWNRSSDVAAIFFNFWIALDGLGWDTYIYILVFCVLVPSILDAIFVLPFIMHFIRQSLHEFFDFFNSLWTFIGRRMDYYFHS